MNTARLRERYGRDAVFAVGRVVVRRVDNLKAYAVLRDGTLIGLTPEFVQARSLALSADLKSR